MSFKIYNVKDHTFNAEKLQAAIAFSSCQYNGILSSGISDLTPYIGFTSDKKPYFGADNTTFSLMCAGYYFSTDSTNISNTAVSNIKNKLIYLEIPLNISENTYNSTDISTEIKVKSADATITKQTLSDDSSDVVLRDYYDIVISGTPAWSGTYKYQTLEYNNKYIVPLAYVDANGNKTIIVGNISGKLDNLYEFLSKNAILEFISSLTDSFDSKYTHQAAGSTGNKVGNFRVNGNTIQYLNNGTWETIIDCSNTSYPKLPQFEDGALYTSNTTLNQGILPLVYGGTNANNKSDARINLGITSGTTLPTSSMGNVGDIYLYIVG